MEPSFIRLERPSQQLEPLLPVCGRCGRTLSRFQLRWCSGACRQYAARMRRELAEYWVKLAARERDGLGALRQTAGAGWAA